MIEKNALHVINLEFMARRDIQALPKWHGARWHAMLREASHFHGFNLDDFLLACFPLRSGTRHIQHGERLILQLLIPAAAFPTLRDFLPSLGNVRGAGEFGADSFNLVRAFDAVTGRDVWQAFGGMASGPVCFHMDFMLAQARVLASLDRWTLRLLSPLRLPLPPGHPERGPEQDKYASPHFLESRAGLDWLLRKLRFQAEDPDISVASLEPAPDSSSLRWEDMRYNQARKIALGGITGQIAWQGRPSLEIARLLVMGRLFGAGKNPRFGLGFWDIPEISL